MWDEPAPAPSDGVDSIVFLQRPKRNQMGDIFQYTSYLPTARLVKLSPPTADGQLTVLCCDQAGPDFANIDIASYDLSFDAKKIVFAGKLDSSQHYGLFVLDLADGQVQQLPTDPNHDYTYPVFVPGDKIVFMTNAVVEDGAPQHRDEYERGTTIQIGRINADGTGDGARPAQPVAPRVPDGPVRRPRDVHRVAPPRHDQRGRPRHHQPRHDDACARASAARAPASPTRTSRPARSAPGRVIAIGTSRDRTIQSGALVDVRLGKVQHGRRQRRRATTRSVGGQRQLPHPDPERPARPLAVVARPSVATTTRTRSTPRTAPTCWCRGRTARSSPARSARPACRRTSASTSTTRRTDAAPPDLQRPGHVGRRPAAAGPARGAAARSRRTARTSSATRRPGRLDGRQHLDHLHASTRPPSTASASWRASRRRRASPRCSARAARRATPSSASRRCAPDGSWAGLIPANVPVHMQPIDKFGMARRHRAAVDLGPPRRVALLRRLPREPHRHHRHPARRHPGHRVRPDRPDEHGAPHRPRVDRLQPRRHHRRALGQGPAAHLRRQVRQLPRRHRERGQPELHHHRPGHRRDRDLDLQPQGRPGQPGGRRLPDGRLQRVLPVAGRPRHGGHRQGQRGHLR